MLEERIGDAPFLAGERPTVADCTLFAALRFARFGGVEIDPACVRLHALVRPFRAAAERARLTGLRRRRPGLPAAPEPAHGEEPERAEADRPGQRCREQIGHEQHPQQGDGGGRALEARRRAASPSRILGGGPEELLRRLELLRRHQEASRALRLE